MNCKTTSFFQRAIRRVCLMMLPFICLAATAADDVVVGAARTDIYLPAIKDKRVALFSNHTGMVGDKHTLDILLENNIAVTTLFSPEHGFRGTADAGEHVSSSVDPVTGIPIASLYDSKSRMPAPEVMDSFDVLIVDIQDVGLRYYTYYCTMIDLMNASVKYDKEVIVFDRPNPNGMYVDGPILDMKLSSGVGRLPIPVVHGMTLGELALMANGEGWLKEGAKANLSIVPMQNYTHQTRYRLPIAPSPNLRNMLSIYLYPSTCYFENTPISIGRGTDIPFLVYGSPDLTNRDFEFTPRSVPGAKNPPLKDQLCYGVDLRNVDEEEAIAQGINLAYVIDAYNDYKAQGKEEGFLGRWFNMLIGNENIKPMVEAGMSAEEIKASWAGDVEKFKQQRRPYLLYAE